MKTTFKSMMMMAMMFMAANTTFAATAVRDHNHNNNKKVPATVVKKECHKRHMHDRTCGGIVVVDRNKPQHPNLSKWTVDHIIKGNHNYDRHDVCKKCKLTRREVRQYERDLTTPMTLEYPTTYPMVRQGRR